MLIKCGSNHIFLSFPVCDYQKIPLPLKALRLSVKCKSHKNIKCSINIRIFDSSVMSRREIGKKIGPSILKLTYRT